MIPRPPSAAGSFVEGQVSWLAGRYLASGLPGFPVAPWTRTRRSQLRGQPRIGPLLGRPYRVPY
jgi:hypothetical protein